MAPNLSSRILVNFKVGELSDLHNFSLFNNKKPGSEHDVGVLLLKVPLSVLLTDFTIAIVTNL